jgi:hypothetical protein
MPAATAKRPVGRLPRGVSTKINRSLCTISVLVAAIKRPVTGD